MAYAFWDSSSIVPLCIQQPSTSTARGLSKQFGMVVWWAAPIEIRGAFARLSRTSKITSNGQVQALVVLDDLRGTWREIQPNLDIRERAEQLIDRFPLTAADALQLAAALAWCHGHTRNRALISGDTQLRHTALQLGFSAIEA